MVKLERYLSKMDNSNVFHILPSHISVANIIQAKLYGKYKKSKLNKIYNFFLNKTFVQLIALDEILFQWNYYHICVDNPLIWFKNQIELSNFIFDICCMAHNVYRSSYPRHKMSF